MEVTSLRGPVEKFEGKLMLRIPLDAGGDQFIECARGISEVDGEYINVIIPDWLAAKLRIAEGSVVSVDNANGKFNITLVPPHELQ